MQLPFLDFNEYTEKSKQKSCLVVGDIIIDKYISGQVSRISPEAPIPVLNVTSKKYVLGGAANVAGNISGLCIKSYLCGVIGYDANGDILLKELNNQGIDFIGVRCEDRATTIKTRVVGMNQQLVRVDEEITSEIDETVEKEMISNIKSAIKNVSVIVISDYNKGVVTKTLCNEIIRLGQEYNVKVIVDPKKKDWNAYSGAYLITPNFKELQEAVDKKLDNTEEQIAKNADNLVQCYNLEHILVTRSQYGMTLVSNGNAQTYKAVQHDVYDVSGAGDTVIATVASFLAIGYSLSEAVSVSSYAAGLAVSKPGTYVVTIKEVIEYINHYGYSFEDKIVSRESLENLISSWKASDERIVFTNGCFDILHIGHIGYLNKARMLGSKLIVAVNSDASVKRLKGDSRPINNEIARALALAALQCIDAVVIFSEDTPEEVVRIVKPNYLVKGGDYKPEEVVGRQYADEVIIMPLTEGYSTTKIIERINSLK